MSCRHILKLHIVTRETTLTIFLLLVCIHTTNIYSYYLPKTYPPYHLNPLKPFRDWIPWLQFLFFCTIFRRYCFILYIFISTNLTPSSHSGTGYPDYNFYFFCTIFRRYCFILYIFISVSPLLGNFSFFRFPVRSQLLILNHCFICQNPVLPWFLHVVPRAVRDWGGEGPLGDVEVFFAS